MNVRTRLGVLFGALLLGGGTAATVGSAAALALPLCAGLPVSIIAQPAAVTNGDGGGVPTDDVILGTPGPDVINALQGNDTVCGLGGDDVINGDTGFDLLLGQAGDDDIDAGADGDTADGGAGNDLIVTGPGGDTGFGGAGDDDLAGGPGNDDLYGEDGDDNLAGGDGMDQLDGGPHVLGDSGSGGLGADTCTDIEFSIFGC